MRPAASRLVLLLEDQATLRQPVRRHLETCGFGVVETDTVDSALTQLRQGAIAAVILDARLAGNHSGLDVLEFLRLNGDWDMPVIVLTGARLSEEEEAIIRRNRAHVFYKPGNYDEMVAQLNRMLLR